MKTNKITLVTALVALLGCSQNNLIDSRPGVDSRAAGLTKSSVSGQSLASSSGDVVGKVTVGYQGWFLAAGDGSAFNSWQHTNLECWPDTREYSTLYGNVQFYQAGTLQPPFTGTLGDGQPAKMFSDWDQSTVNTHFLWMKQNGIDCAALQRFGSHFSDPRVVAQENGIADRVQIAAQTYGRKFYIMYDISGWTNFQTEIKTDWTNTASAHTASSAYARQDGKPVVCIWGIGVSGRPGDVTSWTDVINWFKAQGCYVIAGVPYGFPSQTANLPAYNAANMLMDWRVGRTASTNFQAENTADLNYCNAHGLDYQADVYPGTAFYNTNTSTKNVIPRNHGSFMWQQFAAAKSAGVVSVYVSMFDEMNEATGILKCAEDASMIPAGKYFLTLDADGQHVSSDFYLRLTNDGGNMIKGLIPYTAVLPTAFDYLDRCEVSAGWASGNTLSVNTSDRKEGTASLQSAGSATVEFQKHFTTPVNTGSTAASGSVDFWYYVSDVSKFSAANQIEIGSGGTNDVHEYNWNIGALANGWNHIHKTFATAGTTGGTPDLDAINWFRIYHFKTGSVTTKVDAIIINP